MALHVPGHISETKLALMFGMTVWGLRAWRRRGYGPKAVKIGRGTFYPDTEIAAFIGSASSA